MKAILGDSYFQKNVKEIWCFDCLYDYMIDPAKFVIDNWKKQFGHDVHRLWFYSTGHVASSKGEGGTLTQAQIMEKAKKGVPPTAAKAGKPANPGTPGVPNMDVTITGPWLPHNIKPKSHDNVPVSCLAKLIETSTIVS